MKRVMLFILVMLLTMYTAYSYRQVYSTITQQTFYCYNATNGNLLGTSATINCTDSGNTVDLATIAMSNIGGAGVFNVSLVLPSNEDSYTCKIDCLTAETFDYVESVSFLNASHDIPSGGIKTTSFTAGAIDASAIAASAITSSEAPNLDVAVSTRGTSTLTTTDNIGINWGDVSNPTTTVGLTGTTVGTVTTVTNDVNLLDATEAQIDAIETDTSAMDTSAEWATLNVQTITAIGGNGTTVLSKVSQVNNSVMDIRNTDVPTITSNQDTIRLKIAEVNNTLALTPASVWAYATRTLTSFAFNIGLLPNAVNTTTAPYLDAAISSRSTLTALQVDSQLNSSHGTGNWSATSSTNVSLGNVSVTIDSGAIATALWAFNLTPYINFNTSTVPYRSGDFLAYVYANR